MNTVIVWKVPITETEHPPDQGSCLYQVRVGNGGFKCIQTEEAYKDYETLHPDTSVILVFGTFLFVFVLLALIKSLG